MPPTNIKTLYLKYIYRWQQWQRVGYVYILDGLPTAFDLATAGNVAPLKPFIYNTC